MRPTLLEIKYFETYYFANIIFNVLRNPQPYLRSLDEYFGEENLHHFLKPFPKKTRLHTFISFIIDSIHFQDLNEEITESFLQEKNRKLWVELALIHYKLPFNNFNEWMQENQKIRSEITEDDVVEYINELILSGPYYQLLEKISEEIFFLLFLNRKSLQLFNDMISFRIQSTFLDGLNSDMLSFFKKNGVLKRVKIPKWVQRAVLHRDRGMCVSCNKDLTGIISISNSENFDHIIPLASGGINDVTNIQLLCENCNKSKGSKKLPASIKYEKWF